MVLHKGLKQLEMWEGWRGLPDGLDTQLLIEAHTKVESLDLQISSLPSNLLNALLTTVTAGCSLKELYLRGDKKGRDTKGQLAQRCALHATKVPATLLASAFTRLTKVYLTHTIITTEQVAALMEEISQGNSSLESLSLVKSFYPWGSEQTGPINLKPLVNLEEVHLVGNSFIWEELLDFFAALSPSTKLKKMELTNCSWPPRSRRGTEVMAKAINFLEEVKMELPPYQVCIQISSCCAFVVTF